MQTKTNTKDMINHAAELLNITAEEATIRFNRFDDDAWNRFFFWYTAGLNVD